MERLRVLVIDDSVTIRAVIEQIVEREVGCRVVGTACGTAVAKGLMDDLLPNVITLDLAMSGEDGLQFLDYLRGRMHAPVVVVSSSTTAGAAATAEAFARGADACFDKASVISDASRFMQLLKGVVRRRARQSLNATQRKATSCRMPEKAALPLPLCST